MPIRYSADKTPQELERRLRAQAIANLGINPAAARFNAGAIRQEMGRLQSEQLGLDGTLQQQALSNLGLAEKPQNAPARTNAGIAFQQELGGLQQEANTGLFPSPETVESALSPDDELAQLEAELAGMQPLTSTGPEFQAPQVPGLPGKEIFQNPLLQAIQGDVTRRLFANQAARGKLGSGGTALALQDALAPQALNLGLTLQGREMGQQQQTIDNLFRLFGLGANTAIGQGSQGIGAAQGIGSTVQSGGAAQAGGILGQSQAITGGLGDLAQIGGFFTGGGSFTSPTSSLGGGLFGTQFQPTVANIA
jgi:hypothetical protein